MLVSYDIDGVLADQPPQAEKKWGHMNGLERKARKQFLYKWYQNAQPLLVPRETEFIAISARKKEPLIYDITSKWLTKNFDNKILRIYLLEKSRSLENVIEFKSNVISNCGIQRHYEDNKKVLKGISKLLPDVELYFWEKGMQEAVLYK